MFNDEDLDNDGMQDEHNVDMTDDDDSDEPRVPQVLPEGVQKEILKEGSSSKRPKTGYEVLISVKVQKKDGAIILEKADLEYVVGSESLDACAEACDKALLGMELGEEANLTCSKDYADGLEEGASVTLTLKVIFELKDCSFEKDGSLMKKQVKAGEGYDTPHDAAKVKLSVETCTDGATALPSFSAKVLEFTAGNGDVCDALELVVAEMKKSERAVLTVTALHLGALQAQLGLEKVAADKVVLQLELLEFENINVSDMSDEERLELGVARKAVGANLFKSGRPVMALQCYIEISGMFQPGIVDNWEDTKDKEKAKELRKVCELNKAACYLKLGDHSGAMKATEVVLKDDGENVKAIYRHAQAQLGLKNFSECIRECKRVVELDTKNKDARILLKQAQIGQKELDKDSKGLFANMCKALGKGPIPEPYVASNIQFEGPDGDEDSSDDEPNIYKEA